MFSKAGFEAIDIKIEQHGCHTNLDEEKSTWENTITHPSLTSLQISGSELSQLSSAQLAQVKAEFDAELESLQTEQGIWNDLTTLYILGRKAER